MYTILSLEVAFHSEQWNLLKLIAELTTAQKLKVYLVGGIVRDLLLGCTLHDCDLDLVVEGQASDFAEVLNQRLRGEIKKFPDFGTVKIINPTGFSFVTEVDLASTRTEIYSTPGALPTVKLCNRIEDDLRRRDFSINALALPITEDLFEVKELSDMEDLVIDLFNGVQHLKDRIVHILHPGSFIDDPTRILRGVRYAARIKGSFDLATQDALHEALKTGVFKTISKHRVLRELEKILDDQKSSISFAYLKDYNILDGFDLLKVDQEIVGLVEKYENYTTLKQTAGRRFLIFLLIFERYRSANQNVDRFDPWTTLQGYSFSKREFKGVFDQVKDLLNNRGSDHFMEQILNSIYNS